MQENKIFFKYLYLAYSTFHIKITFKTLKFECIFKITETI